MAGIIKLRHRNRAGGGGSLTNSFFDNLLATRSDIIRAVSGRPIPGQSASSSAYYESQLLPQASGGFLNGGNTANFTYDFTNDTHAEKQDACKVIIPAFESFPVTSLSVDITDTTSTTFTLGVVNDNTTAVGAVLKIDDEYVGTIASKVNGTPGTVTVNNRGFRGTTKSTHTAGANVFRNRNSTESFLDIPLGLTVGEDNFVYIWDDYRTQNWKNVGDFGLVQHKAYQVVSLGSSDPDPSGGIWFEPQTNFQGRNPNGGTVAGWDSNTYAYSVMYRAYDYLNVDASYGLDTIGTKGNPIKPQAATFLAPLSEWVRWWVRIRTDYSGGDGAHDYIDCWVASESQDPVQVIVDLPYLVRTLSGSNRLQTFWWEFNTSTDTWCRNNTDDDLVWYVKNFICLNTADMSGLLVKPIG
jgi:hypothetical protein